MPIIPVSFKNTKRDMKLYNTVKNLEEQSAFIKNAIEMYLLYLKRHKNKPIYKDRLIPK